MKNYTSFGARSSRVSGNQSFDEDARRIRIRMTFRSFCLLWYLTHLICHLSRRYKSHPSSFVITNCRKLLFLRNCRSPHYVILPLHCHQFLIWCGNKLESPILHPLPEWTQTDWQTLSYWNIFTYVDLFFLCFWKYFFMELYLSAKQTCNP